MNPRLVIAVHFACLCAYDVACLFFATSPTPGDGYFLVPVAWALGMLVGPGHPLARSVLTLLSVIFQALRTSIFFISGARVDEAFFYHFDTGNLVGLLTYRSFLIALGVAFLLQIAFLLATSLRTTVIKSSWRVAALAVLAPVLFASPVGSFVSAYRASLPASETYAEAVAELAKQGVDFTTRFSPERIGDDPPKNLLFVFLESFETNYLDDSIYPGLSPNLRAISQSSLHASNLAPKWFTGFTVAGMFSALCGIPFAHQGQANNAMHTLSIEHLPCLGTVLARLGYRQSFIQGSDIAFSGLASLYAQMSYDEILGSEELKQMPEFESRERPSRWGYHDADVLRFALQRAVSLGEDARPFSLTVATVDSHHPGYPGALCPRYESKSGVLRAIHCLDASVARFVDGFRASPLYDDTLLVLLGDHLSMRPPVRVQGRRVFAAFLGASVPTQVVTRAASHFDMAPTALELLGIQGVRYPLGASLLQRAPEVDIDSHELLRSFAPILAFNRKIHLGRDGLSIQQSPARLISGATNRMISFANGEAGDWPRDHYHMLRVTDDGHIVGEATIPRAKLTQVVARTREPFILSGHLSELARRNQDLAQCRFGLLYVRGKDAAIPYVCAEQGSRSVSTTFEALQNPDEGTPVLRSLF